MADDCIFCKIVAGDIPSYKIHESDDFLAVLDISQFVPGHTIAIPKEHRETMWDVENVGAYFKFIQDIGNHFRNIGYEFVDTLTMGRMVHHSHVHLIPHNGAGSDWEAALEAIGQYQVDPDRRPDDDEAKKTREKFKLS